MNRSKTFASQTITTTSPNTKGLLRVNYKTIYADDGSSAFGRPVTCPEPPSPTPIPSVLPPRPAPNTENLVYPLSESQTESGPTSGPGPEPQSQPQVMLNEIEQVDLILASGSISPEQWIETYADYTCGPIGLPEQPEPSKYKVTNTEKDPSYPVLCPQYVNPADFVQPIPVQPIPPSLPPRVAPPGPILDLPYLNPVPPPPEREVIPDGGNFICVQQDICEAAENPGQQPPVNTPDYCNPTTASDVPGPVQFLCYNSLANKPYYPRKRYKMTNSGDKFPTGYKFMM